ncbi:hypothetical protein FHX42_003927 [Saccharopolyspora lacisalsi]|uniref:DNA primase/polymerase bifunctional N-terminal domain-containing protein n=1 Tax=Halosaccharopolyspora lacisalsi TaxID=1000566 RepID=A0A839E6N8_9PSEU|nr:bifunctional DNA primase/polymerase [Halosaccharopolyspora lacisalsi]MBA8826548.1 hypothetical protein [Halosaccharopolyspora lacisalsi]
MDWSADGWRGAFRVESRVEAMELTSRGWPVLPGTYPTNSGWAGREGEHAEDARGPVPIHRDWRQRIDTRPDEVVSWWSGEPYSLLLATGPGVEALEVGTELGRRTAAVLRGLDVLVPIVATPGGRWYFLTRGGQRLCSELDTEPDVRLHGEGSWVPMPPTVFPVGLVHWRVKPHMCGWRLPDPELVQNALCAGQPGEAAAPLLAAAG